MKKLIIVAIVALLIYGIAFVVLVNTDEFVLTQHPQSPVVAENGIATYTVKGTGGEKIAQWYMHWNGETYKISELTDAKQPWEAYAGTSYGPQQIDNNTFSYVFEGIGSELDGAHIWAVVHCGNYSTKTQVAVIQIEDTAEAPVITEIPLTEEIVLGEEWGITCVAQAPDGNSALSYQWYETSTGKLEDIKPLDLETANTDTLLVENSELGTRYYVCRVETAEGGVTYSSVVRTTVTDGITFDENAQSNFYDFVDEQDIIVEKAKESGGNNLWILFVIVLLFGFGYSVYSFQKKAKQET